MTPQRARKLARAALSGFVWPVFSAYRQGLGNAAIACLIIVTAMLLLEALALRDWTR